MNDHDAARTIARQQIELAMREMLGEAPGVAASVFKKASAEVRREQLAPYLQGRFQLNEALVARFLGEPQFEQQFENATPERYSLTSMLAANPDDTDLIEWLERAEVGACYVAGGGAGVAVSVRRVS